MNDPTDGAESVEGSAAGGLDERDGAAVGRRGPAVIVAAFAGVGGTAIGVVALPGLWRLSVAYAVLFALLALAELVAIGLLLVRPTRRRALLTLAIVAVVLLVWALDRVVRVLPAPDPWQPADTVLGLTDAVAAGLQVLAGLGTGVVALRGGGRVRRTSLVRVVAWLAVVPVVAVVVACTVVGVVTASDLLAGTGLATGFLGSGAAGADSQPGGGPGGRVGLGVEAASNASGRVAGTADLTGWQARARRATAQAGEPEPFTLAYCKPGGIPLGMDLYAPVGAAAQGGLAGRTSPVAVYVHGGGFVLGDRKAHGVGHSLAGSPGALFEPLRARLTARGFVVASIDYRLAPATPWPAPITDTKCAIRFLRAHAAALGIDPARVAVWGSSAGGTLASLVGTTGPSAGFDIGPNTAQSSRVQAVVDMFGPADLANLRGLDPFIGVMTRLALGGSAEVRRAASPAAYRAEGAPPFLILQGDDDSVRLQSVPFAARLRAAGVRVTYVPVRGAGHGFDSPGSRPTPGALADRVTRFLVDTLR